MKRVGVFIVLCACSNVQLTVGKAEAVRDRQKDLNLVHAVKRWLYSTRCNIFASTWYYACS